MIDADANSVMSAAGIIANPGVQVPPVVHVAGTDEPHKRGHWGTRRFLKLIGAAAVLTIIVTLIAVAVHNSSDDGQTPAPSTVPVTEPATTPATSTTSSTPSTTTTTSTSTTTIVGTSTSGT
jgi:hypothetical protein